jgi:hypothetical protein
MIAYSKSAVFVRIKRAGFDYQAKLDDDTNIYFELYCIESKSEIWKFYTNVNGKSKFSPQNFNVKDVPYLGTTCIRFHCTKYSRLGLYNPALQICPMFLETKIDYSHTINKLSHDRNSKNPSSSRQQT